jgi:hypothetical protein
MCRDRAAHRNISGSADEAMAALKLPPRDVYLHQAEDPARLVKLPL